MASATDRNFFSTSAVEYGTANAKNIGVAPGNTGRSEGKVKTHSIQNPYGPFPKVHPFFVPSQVGRYGGQRQTGVYPPANSLACTLRLTTRKRSVTPFSKLAIEKKNQERLCVSFSEPRLDPPRSFKSKHRCSGRVKKVSLSADTSRWCSCLTSQASSIAQIHGRT